jgi:hypothetical protein
MKITKYIFLLLLLFSIAFIVFVATQPNEYEITREKEIAASRDNVFNYINDFTTWEDWFKLKEFDSSCEISYTEGTSGVNSGFSWKSSTSTGKITTTKNVLQDTILQNITIDNEPHTISWFFSDSKKGTKVKWLMKGKISFKWKLKTILQSGIEAVYGNLFEKGINNIDHYLVTELNSVKIIYDGIVTKHAANFIQQKDSCKIEDFQAKSKKMLQNMIEFVETNDISLKGLPFVMVKKKDENKNYIIYSMCVPVEEEILTTEGSEISGGHFDEFLAYKTTLNGDYKHLKKARTKTIEALSKEKYVLDTTFNYIEIYKSSLPKVKNPSQWVTELYFPIKKKVYIPTIKTDSIQTQTNKIE